MQPSSECFDLIKKWEGLHKVGSEGLVYAYLDPVGIPTIGYGSIYNLDEDRTVRLGDVITKQTAQRWLEIEVQEKAKGVNALCKVPLKQCMFDALVSFAFNIGLGQFEGSTLLKKLNQSDYEGAVREFDRWVHGGGGVLPGLINRRNDEEILFRREGFALVGTTPMGSGNSNNGSPTVEERPYQPAYLPLAISRTLREGDIGDDCHILNCALAGLGMLAMGTQPNQFTAVTKNAVSWFQNVAHIPIDAEVLKGSLRQKKREQKVVFCPY